MNKPSFTYESGAVSGMLIALVGMIVLVIGMSGLAIWSYVNYTDQKNNVDSKIATAVAVARKDQADTDEAKFAEREKEPLRVFVGPDDYGRVTFDYPKTWSAHVARDASNGGTYEAYLNPIIVPPISTQQQFALRVTIDEQDYDRILTRYEALIRSGKLASSSFSANGHSGTRFDGEFSQDIRGSAVILRIRDKTVTIRTDANTFKPDFDRLIKTIDFND